PGRLRLRQPVQFRGTIETLPENGLIGTWVISGQSVQVTEATRIFQVKGQVAVGAEVFVIGWQQDDVITAGVITVLRSPLAGGTRFQFQGVIGQLPTNGHPRFPLVGKWVISGQEVYVQINTRITNGENARIGAEVEVTRTFRVGKGYAFAYPFLFARGGPLRYNCTVILPGISLVVGSVDENIFGCSCGC
ncbi:MAG: DUF5666 domain-containing protein, partial [Anaerolineae bacterium]